MDSDDENTESGTESCTETTVSTNIITKSTPINNIDSKNIKRYNTESNNNSRYVPPSERRTDNEDNNWSHNTYKKRNNRKHKNIEVGEGLKYYNNSIDIKGNNMKLNSTWTVWIHENSNTEWDIESYDSIYTIDNIGSLWRFLLVFDNLDKNVRQYYIMRDGITPIWEDNNNKKGGICSIMFGNMMNRHRRNLRGDIGVDIFIAICILVLNESFVKNNLDINGLCYSIKNRCVLIKLWIKDYDLNTEFIELLPISLLKKIDSIISMMENENNILRNNGRSSVSVQFKKIQPNY
jgi:hypothetical protein